MRWLTLLICFSGCATVSPTLKMTPRTQDNLVFLYDHIHTEFAFCLYGEANSSVVWVKHLELPTQIATDDTVNYDVCPADDLLGYGHSHPKGSLCEFSDTDINTFLSSPTKFAFLMCENGRIKMFHKRGK